MGRSTLALHLMPALAAVLATFSCSGPPLPEEPVALFSRHYLEPIYLEDVPRQEEIERPLHLSAALGEYEPLSLGVFAREGLRGARIECGPLVGPGEARIGADAIEIRVTRYVEPFRRWVRLKRHPLQPGFLDRRREADVPQRGSRQFWLTIRVPDHAPAGSYRGTIRLTAPALSEPIERELELRVRGFKLPEARPAYFLYGDNYPLSDATFAESRRHGMNTICVNHGWTKNILPVYRDGSFEYPASGLERLREVVETARRNGLVVDRPLCIMLYSHLTLTLPVALREAGIEPPGGLPEEGLRVPTAYELLYPREGGIEGVERQKGTYYASSDPTAPPSTPFGRALYAGWVASMRTFDRLAHEAEWPPVYYYLIDEPHQTRGGMRLAMQMVRAADEAGADGMVTCNEPTVSEPDEDRMWFPAVGPEPALRLEPWIKTRCYHNKYLSPTTLERTRQAGDHYATYINIYGNQPASTRYLAGYFAYRLELERVMLWQWKNVSTEDGDGRSYLRDWEAVREGIDDIKYLQLLEQLVRGGSGPPDAIERGQALLGNLRERIDPDLRRIGRVDSVSGEWEPGSASWTPEHFDDVRDQVAAAIEALLAQDAAVGSRE